MCILSSTKCMHASSMIIYTCRCKARQHNTTERQSNTTKHPQSSYFSKKILTALGGTRTHNTRILATLTCIYVSITLSRLQCCGGGEGGCGKEKRGDEEGGGKDGKEAMLQSLVLSGCHQITDVGLRSDWLWFSLCNTVLRCVFSSR